MTRIQHIVLSTAILTALTAVPVLAGQNSEKLRGEVVAVQQQTQGQGGGQVVTVRVRNGEQKQFRLGDQSACQGCVQVGDQVRVQVSRGSGNQSGQIKSMKVKRHSKMYGYSNQSGQLVRTRQRLKDGSGSGRQAGMQGRGTGGGSRGGRGGAGGGGTCDGSGRGSRGGGGRGGGGR